jgi:hypothetical protein
MRRPQAIVFGIPIWGLGNILYTDNGAGGFIIGHDGNNYPAINTTARLDPANGDGIVVLETGNDVLASEIGRDWVFWHTGHVGTDTIVLEARHTLAILAGGLVVFVLVTAAILWRARRRRTQVRVA